MQAKAKIGNSLPLLILAATLTAVSPVAGELIEEIVAWVDGDIITMSEFKQEEQELIAELYRRFSGEDLDRQVQLAREGLLMQMIDRKILLHRASRVFDLEKVGESYLAMFKDQRRVASDEEFEKMLAQAGLTVEGFQKRLVEQYAPQEVVRMEVGNRVAVGDPEVEEYYRTHPEEFSTPAEVQLREIVLLAEPENREARRAEADAVRRRAAQPAADFAALAGEVSQAGTAGDGGLLGPLRKGELSESLEQVAFTLPVGQVSEVLEMPYGFHILRVEQRSEAIQQPLDDVRESLREMLEERKYMTALEAFLVKARDEADWEVDEKYRHRLPGGAD